MELFTYVLKSAGILTLFYLVYRMVLQRDTFFTANRTYLLAGILAALTLPFVTFTTVTFIETPVLLTTNSEVPLAPLNSINNTTETASFDFWTLVSWAYLAGVVLMFVHFSIQLFSLLKLLFTHSAISYKGYRMIETSQTIAPFSFFNYIVYNPTTHQPEELQMILAHEKVHASQWHSLDILLANCMRAFQWLNPFAWFYKSSIEANLEFLADSETVAEISSKTEYQMALLKASSTLPVPAL
ncbi:MAG: M56 family metallopeptidase, partial [Marinirhabdus sp.]|nr:M56 family metallopeptidase [Marinirhabdus sp.]